MTDFAPVTAGGQIFGLNATYLTARSTPTGFDTAATTMNVGQRFVTPNYRVFRAFIKFDTSTIGADSTVTQVNLRMGLANANGSDEDFDIQIVKHDWSSQDPITTDNMNTAFDACLAGTADSSIFFNTSNFSSNQLSGDLDTSWINKTGNTYYSLRSSRDVNGDVPTGNEYITFYSANYTTTPSRRIYLVVTYTTASGTVLRVNFNAQMQNLSGGF